MGMCAFDVMKTCQKGDPMYGLLPPMFYDAEKKKYYIYTMVKTPLKEHVEMMDLKDPKHPGKTPVKVLDFRSKLLVYLVFDWQNKIRQEGLTEGKIYISKADSLACISMDYESRNAIDVLYYMDLNHDFDDYCTTSQLNLQGSVGKAQGYKPIEGLVSYPEALQLGNIPEAVEFALSPTNLIGGYRHEAVVTYEDDPQYGHNVRQVRSQQVHYDGILSDIVMQHVYFLQ